MIRKRLPKKRSRAAHATIPVEPFDAKRVVEIQRLSHDGNGIGFSQGYTISVPFTLPTEKILVENLQTKDRLIAAHVKQVQHKSEQRVDPVCEYFTQCGGCDLQHIKYEEQVNLKQQQFLWQFKSELFKDAKSKKASGIEQPLIGPSFEYRHRIRLTVQEGKVGFMRAGSHNVIEVNHCPIAHPHIQAHLLMSKHPIIAQLHGLQNIEWLVDDCEALAIRLMFKKIPSQAKIDKASRYLLEHGINCYRFESEGSVFQYGDQLIQNIDALSYGYYPGQFTQVNAAVNKKMLQQAEQWILQIFSQTGTDLNSALDLFCGMGNFTLMLAKHFKHTVGLEGASDAIVCAKQNAKVNQEYTELNEVNFIEQDLFARKWGDVIKHNLFDLVILDPPRAGAKQICTDIEQLRCKFLLYISCNQATLKRDAQLLKARGYAVERAGIMDMFAQTHHIETMMLFRKL